jgi:transcriptional antiterminator RfaH
LIENYENGGFCEMSSSWYVIQSHPNKEQLLFKQIVLLGIEVFYPKIKVKPVNPRSRKIRPYFPGYLFIRTEPEMIGTSTIKWMPHSKGIVAFGGEPSIVPESLIHALKQKVGDSEDSVIEIKDEFNRGTPISIEFGPFEGYEGIFDTKLEGSDRVRILLKMLINQYVPVELEISHIQRKKTKPKNP